VPRYLHNVAANNFSIPKVTQNVTILFKTTASGWQQTAAQTAQIYRGLAATPTIFELFAGL